MASVADVDVNNRVSHIFKQEEQPLSPATVMAQRDRGRMRTVGPELGVCTSLRLYMVAFEDKHPRFSTPGVETCSFHPHNGSGANVRNHAMNAETLAIMRRTNRVP